jgi:hypothetical protein
MKNFAFIMVVSLFSSIKLVNAEDQLSKKQVEKLNYLNVSLFNSLENEKYVKANRLTKEGVLNSCELEFQNIYQDVRGRKEGVMNTVFIAGSFSTIYYKSRHALVYALKGVPAVMNVKNKNWDKLYPSYFDIFINGEALGGRYYAQNFQCDNEGKCIGYTDSMAGSEILNVALKNYPFDAEIKLSLINGGTDTGFKLSELSSSNISIKEREAYSNCILELANLLMSDLKKEVDSDKK